MTERGVSADLAKD